VALVLINFSATPTNPTKTPIVAAVVSVEVRLRRPHDGRHLTSG
jgi:hypothetical protein